MSMLRIFAPLLMLAASPALLAVEIAHWAPDAASPTRELRQSTGALRAWDWAGGIKIFDATANKEFTIARDTVVSVSRNEKDRSPELERAINGRNMSALNQLATNGRDDFEKEEATWHIAHLRSLSGGAAGVEALKTYIQRYPQGNFALESRLRLANLLAGNAQAPQNNVQEANRILEEAAALGGEVAKAAGNLVAGELALLRASNGAAVEKLAIAVASAKAVRHLEYQIRALVAHGRALAVTGKNAEAKVAFTEALGVPLESEYNLSNMHQARGEAQIGLAQIAGESREGYDAWVAASCWFTGKPAEAQCLLSALDIAEAMAARDAEEWGARAKELRSTLERTYRSELQAHDRKKAASER